jgi:hypothetical protein
MVASPRKTWAFQRDLPDKRRQRSAWYWMHGEGLIYKEEEEKAYWRCILCFNKRQSVWKAYVGTSAPTISTHLAEHDIYENVKPLQYKTTHN